MFTLPKSIVLGAVIFTAVGATILAKPAAAADPATASPQVAAATLPEVVVRPNFPGHYTVPTGYDSNVWLHPYTSGLGPCTEGASPSQGCHHDTGHPILPSHYERAPFNQ